jgi:hypothetical protein
VEALDLVGRLGEAVDATEHERCVTQIELGEPVDQGLVEHVALVAGLERAAERRLAQVAQLPRVGTALFEAVVGVVDVRLLLGKVGMLLRHGSEKPTGRVSGAHGGGPPDGRCAGLGAGRCAGLCAGRGACGPIG